MNDKPSIDHGFLSPSGRMSSRARKAALERIRKGLFPDGLPHPTAKQPSRKEMLLRRAKELRELAARGMSPRKFNREAEKLETEASAIEEEDMKDKDQEMIVAFRHGPYGPSYFGSGGGWGGVEARKPDGSPEPNVVWALGDNGFVSGPVGVVSAPQGTKIVAVGGDYINEGRRWREEYTIK